MYESENCVHVLSGTMALKTKSENPIKMKFNGDKSKSTKIKATIPSEESGNKNKHIIFDNDDNDNNGGVIVENKQTPKKNHKNEKNRKNAMDIGAQWYQTVSFFFVNTNRFFRIKLTHF